VKKARVDAAWSIRVRAHAADRYYRLRVIDDAPIELLGFDEERGVILARRAGDPSFLWVQDLEDAYQAAGSVGGVDVVVSRRVLEELRAAGFSPLELQGLRVI